MRRRAAALLLGLSFVAGPAVASHPKTDIVTLDSGDRFHGEIKKVEQGTLTLKTDAVGTISVKWTHVASLVSKYRYEVEATSGERYFGTLAEPDENGLLKIVGLASVHDMPLADVFWLLPIEDSFWKNLDGSINSGFSYTQSNEAVQYSLSADVEYVSRKVGGSLQLSSIFNTSKDAESASQQSLSLIMWRPLKAVDGRLTLSGVGQFQSNPNQGYDLRSVGGGGVGLFLRQMSGGFTLINAGVAGDREEVTDSTEVTTDVSLLLGLKFSRYRKDFPKYNIGLGVSTFTYMTDWPRFRAQVDFKLSFEVVHSLTVSLNVMDSYDSQPATADASNNDLSVTSSLGYTF